MNTRTALALVAGAAFFAGTSTAHAQARTPDIVMARHSGVHAHRHVTQPVHATGVLRLTITDPCAGAHTDGSTAQERGGASATVRCVTRGRIIGQPATGRAV